MKLEGYPSFRQANLAFLEVIGRLEICRDDDDIAIVMQQTRKEQGYLAVINPIYSEKIEEFIKEIRKEFRI